MGGESKLGCSGGGQAREDLSRSALETFAIGRLHSIDEPGTDIGWPQLDLPHCHISTNVLWSKTERSRSLITRWYKTWDVLQ